MASYLTMFDLAQLQNNDYLLGLTEDVTTYAAEFSVIPVIQRTGTSYKTVRRISLPSAGFRQINQGVSLSKSNFKQEVKEMFYLDVPINVDEAIYKADDRSTGDILSHEMQGALQSALITIGTQTYYGTSTDGSNGFVGIRAQLAGVQSTSGSVAAGASTSCYGLWLAPQGVHFDVGNMGAIELPTPQRQQISAINGSGVNFAWVTNLSTWIGLSVDSQYSTWAITGITTHQGASTNTLTGLNVEDQALTDILASKMVAQIPLNRRVGLTWFCNRSALGTLQRSRTAVNFQPAGPASGTPAVSPPATYMENFPIVVTDSITNTETN